MSKVFNVIGIIALLVAIFVLWSIAVDHIHAAKSKPVATSTPVATNAKEVAPSITEPVLTPTEKHAIDKIVVEMINQEKEMQLPAWMKKGKNNQ